jgi:hypothetical protein
MLVRNAGSKNPAQMGRRLISLSVTPNPTAEWIASQITEPFPWDEAPDYLIRDRDSAIG